MGIFDAFSSAPGQNAANLQVGAITQGLGQLNTNYGNALNSLNTDYSAGLAPSLANVNTANQGTTAYLNLLGLGPGGQQGQLSALQATPGYQFQLQQGGQQVLRNQAQAGQLNSGGTDLALQAQGQGLANQTYNQAVQNLNPFINYSTANANNVLGGYGNLGNQAAGTYQGLGNADYGANASIGNAQAQGALAPYQASQNLWNLVGNLAGSAAKAYGAS